MQAPTRSICRRSHCAPALIVVLAAAVAAAGCGDPTGTPLASDDELLAVFHRERAAFDSLTLLLDEDRHIQMLDRYAEHVQFLDLRTVAYHDSGASAPGLSADRWNTYERLLRRAGTGRNVWNSSDGILFQQYVAKFGPEDTRWMRGYWYSREPGSPVGVTTSDLLAESTWTGGHPSRAIRHRPIEGAWFLYTHRGYSN